MLVQKDMKVVGGRARLLSTAAKSTAHISPLELSKPAPSTDEEDKENMTPSRPRKPGNAAPPKLGDNNGRLLPGSRKRLADGQVSSLIKCFTSNFLAAVIQQLLFNIFKTNTIWF